MEDQQQFQNQGTTPNPYTPYGYQNQPVLSVGDWFVTILITAIPLVNIIMLFVWAFSSSTNPNKANWAKASLIWLAIGIVMWLIFGAMFLGLMNSFR